MLEKSKMNKCNRKRIAIIGAGPAGLTAAYLLGKSNLDVVLFEKDNNYVGGISRTESYKGFHFDIGGHRFFSKSKEVEDFWTEILGDEMLERPRSSRIFYNNKFYSYPLSAFEALSNLGMVESINCILSYLKFRFFPIKNPENFQQWVTNQFGKRLFNIFFKTYTEKVWGIPCDQISADWASQRIKGLSLSSAIRNALFKSKSTKRTVIKTLIDSFRYPKYGPGMMWETCLKKCVEFGVEIKMGTSVSKISFNQNKWSVATIGQEIHSHFDFVISSAPIRDLIPNILPLMPTEVIEAAGNLKYRDFITVVLICKEQDAFKDNWIYIHDSSVKVGRIQNFKSWSPFMVPDVDKACYGLEYFCFENDGLWESKNDDLIALATKEMTHIGLIKQESVIDGYVVRQSKAYPVYDHEYKNHLHKIRNELNNYPGLYLVGRNGMHKYNNQDHSMMTSMLAVKNIISNKTMFDLWQVNEDAEYHEGGTHKAESSILGRQVPGIV